MKFIFFLGFGLFFGFFDVFILISFLALSLSFLFLDFSFFWFGGYFFMDSLSFFLSYLTILILYFCFFSNLSDFWGDGSFFSYIFVVSSIFFLLFLSFMSLNVLIFYMSFELIFMFMFFFVMTWGYSPERVQASYYMVFYTIVVSFPFLVFIVLFESHFFSMKFTLVYSFSLYWWFFLLFVFMIKLPVYGVHLWLPKAHVEAPVAGSMVLAGVLLKLGAYGVFRFSNHLSFSLFKNSGYLFSVGLLGGLASCFVCLRQSDLKAFVAYSSVCHMGFGLAGIYSSSCFGFLGGLYMMIGHGFCSSCLFYVLYILYKRLHTRSLFLVKGIGYTLPYLVLVWFLFSIINMGVPPSLSFFSEVFILIGTVNLFFFSFVVSGVFLMVAGIYCIFLFVVTSHGFFMVDNSVASVQVREFLNCYGHFYPLFFLPFFLCSFYI